MASEISGQNSLTIPSSFLRAKIFSSDIGSSSSDRMPAEIELEVDLVKKSFIFVIQNIHDDLRKNAWNWIKSPIPSKSRKVSLSLWLKSYLQT